MDLEPGVELRVERAYAAGGERVQLAPVRPAAEVVERVLVLRDQLDAALRALISSIIIVRRPCIIAIGALEGATKRSASGDVW